MSELAAYDAVLERICVCRTFRLDGLQTVLKETGHPIDPVQIIWQVGELNAEDLVCLDKNLSNYIVMEDKPEIQSVRQTLQKESRFREFHNAWENWHDKKYTAPKFYVEDLAALLYHEAAVYHENDIREGKSLSEQLQPKLYQYLNRYCQSIAKRFEISWTYHEDDFPQAFIKFVYTLRGNISNEVASYPIKLRQHIQELALFKGILSDEEGKTFLTFLDALNH